MEAKNHKCYIEEKERLEYVKEAIEEERELLNNKTYNGVNEDVMAHMVYLDGQRIKKLNKSIHNPYFGRINFRESNHDEVFNIYIGKASVTDFESDNEDDMLVTDWRAPISTLYYDCNLGSANYNCPDGNIGGELTLKRNYKIEDGELVKITDVDVSAIDEMLLEALEDKKDTKLKDIVSTIQSEQNEIIRADLMKSLIIQGVAGSGKTTIALHRIAYLIYTYKQLYSPDEFMIIAPNKLFLQYIEDLLPELGVEDVEQTTMESLTKDILSEPFLIDENDDKLKKIIENEDNIELVKTLRDISKIKTQMEFKDILDEFINEIIRKVLPKDDFLFEGVLIMEASQVSELFYENYKRYSVIRSIKLIKKVMTNKFDNSRENIEESISVNMNKKLTDMEKTDKNEYKKAMIENHKEQQQRVKNMKKNFTRKMNGYLKEPKKSILKYYQQFLMTVKLIEKLVGDEKTLIDSFKLMAKNMQKNSIVEIEDLPALMYLQYKLKGAKEMSKYKHIVIDEGQDFGAFQFYVLKAIMKEATFSILGDIAQGINYHRGTNDWKIVRQQVFRDQCQIKHLLQSYRTTVEIMNAANDVIKNVDDENIILAEPVIRHGEQVEVIEQKNIDDIANCISTEINALLKKHNSIAVICKNNQQCKMLYGLLTKKGIEIQWLEDKESEYTQQVVLLPSYLAKGLEFDCVIIPDAGQEQYKVNRLDGMLLYVAMTRALHELKLYYINKRSHLLL